METRELGKKIGAGAVGLAAVLAAMHMGSSSPAPSGTGFQASVSGVTQSAAVSGPDVVLEAGSPNAAVVQSASGYAIVIDDTGGAGKFPFAAQEMAMAYGSTHPVNALTKTMTPTTTGPTLSLIGTYVIPGAGAQFDAGGVGTVEGKIRCWDSSFKAGDAGLVDFMTSYYSFDYTVTPSGAIALSLGGTALPAANVIGGDGGVGLYGYRASGGAYYDGGAGGGYYWFGEIIADGGTADGGIVDTINFYASGAYGMQCTVTAEDDQGGL